MNLKRLLFVCSLACLFACLWQSAGAAEAVQNGGIRVSGNVTDDSQDRNPIPGSVILVKGTTTSAVTDANGNFYLTVPGENSVLVFSAFEKKTQEVRVGTDIYFGVALTPDVTALDEVVATAFSTQRRLSVVAAVETVNPSDLQVSPTRSVANSLGGNVTGVIAVRRSGEPGYDNSEFWIRGVSTFSGSSSPLILVDGIERNINDVDPNEIETMSVLKDAGASAMYGVRGANGVIVITTKRGKIGAPKIEVRFEHSIQRPTMLPEFADAADHMELLNELNTGIDAYSQERIDRTRNGYDPDVYAYSNWVDEITKDYAYSTRANVSVSGGSDFLRYSLVASYFNEKGITERDYSLPYDTSMNLNQYNMRSNVDIDITKTTTLSMNIGGYLRQRMGPNKSVNDAFNEAFLTSNFVHPARYSDGTIPRVTNRNNPWAALTGEGYKDDAWSQIQSSASINQNLDMLTEGLHANVLFSFDSYASGTVTRSRGPEYWDVATSRDMEGNLIHSVTTTSDGALSRGQSGSYGTKQVYLQATLNYDRSFGKSDVSALLLYMQQSRNDPAGSDGAGALQPYRKQGLSGRVSYTYDNRYVAEVNFGYNGSENFLKGERYGFFPSLSLGWIVSEEPFMASTRDVISKLKLRGSVGLSGNDNIGGNRRFAFLTTLDVYGGAYGWGGAGNRNGIREAQIGVSGLTWETSLKYNVGLELSLWNSLDLQFDVFQEERSDIFMQRQIIPSQSGFRQNPWANYGKVRNRGMEISMGYNKSINDDWSIGLRGSFSYARNEIIEIDEPAAVKGTYRGETGRQLGTLQGLIAERLFTVDDFMEDGVTLRPDVPNQVLGATVRPGDIKYVDRNGDGVVNAADSGRLSGSERPNINYGFGGSVRYKNVDLGFFFSGVGQTYRIIGNDSSYFLPGSGNGLLGNPYSNYQDRWTEDNPSQDVFWPRLSTSVNDNNSTASTWWKRDMSFLRLKTIEIGYSFNPDLVSHIGMKGLRVYVSGNDLLTFSKFKLWDPELGTNTGFIYPPMSSIMFGITLNF